MVKIDQKLAKFGKIWQIGPDLRKGPKWAFSSARAILAKSKDLAKIRLLEPRGTNWGQIGPILDKFGQNLALLRGIYP